MLYLEFKTLANKSPINISYICVIYHDFINFFKKFADTNEYSKKKLSFIL